MKIHITLIAYALPVSPLIRTLAGPDTTFHLFLHSDNAEVIEDIERYVLPHYNTVYHAIGENRGLAASWNDGLIESQQTRADVMIIANDDISMDRADLRTLSQGALTHRDTGVIICQGYDGNMHRQQQLQHVVFAINPIAIEKIGYFDENFFPIYFEDTDYSRRCGLAGVTYYDAGPTGIQHRGSTTIKTNSNLYTQNNTTFQKNRDYYIRKWGGEPGKETAVFPFGNEDFGYRIAEDYRHNPYREFDRIDREIVKL